MDERDKIRISGRLRRRNLWLGVGLAIHLAATVASIRAAVGGMVLPVSDAVGVVALSISTPFLLVWFERRTAIWNRPARWLRRALGVLAPHGVAIGITTGAILTGFAWPVRVACPLLLVLVQAGCVTLASRAVRYPLTPELGRMRVEVEAKIRSTDNLPALASPHDVRLTNEEIIITVRPSISYCVMPRISLDAVTSAAARPALPQDSPWIRIPEGGEYFVTSGDVVEVKCRSGSAVLPVYDAAAFTEVLRSRLETMRSDDPVVGADEGA
jgi:hypothetical protein